MDFEEEPNNLERSVRFLDQSISSTGLGGYNNGIISSARRRRSSFGRHNLSNNDNNGQITIYRQMSESLAARKRFSISAQSDKCLAKVRWLQDDHTLVLPDPHATEYFVSASYSSGQSNNAVSLWKLEVDGINDDGSLDARTQLVSEDFLHEDTTDMVVTEAGNVVISTVEGSVQFYSCGFNDSTGEFSSIRMRSDFKNAHNFRRLNVPATGVDSFKSSVVSVGEDGSIVEYALESNSVKVKKRWDSADTLSIHCVKFVGTSQILTGNSAGQLKLWDLRASSNSSSSPLVQTMNATDNLYAAVTIAQHPSQSHLVIVGYQSGTVDLWDLRRGSGCDPVVNVSADESSLNEMYFHKVNPDHFFSCSETGQVRHWYPSENDNDPEFLQGIYDQAKELNIEFLKRELVFSDIHSSPLPINSISLSKNDRIISAGDSGILHITTVSTNN